jgi:gliding motility-associated-like protein
MFMRPAIRCWVLAFAGFVGFHIGHAQLLKNIRPIIVGQNPLRTEMGRPITIELSDLIVIDYDDPYPAGFTLTLYKGKHYTFSNTTVTPDNDFTGTLKVHASVNDGQSESRIYELVIEVVEVQNVPPVITAQVPLSMEENTSLTLSLSDLSVTDPDNDYPSGFTLKVYPGQDYKLTGKTIKPNAGFKGTLHPQVSVNDGKDDSNIFTLDINVYPANKPPVITGQIPLTIEENSTLTLLFSYLKVTDPDNNYPQGFTLRIYAGKNYGVSGNTITPDVDFTGVLNPVVSVNDGKDDSNLFTLAITVTPQNVAPVITGQVSLEINEDESLTLLLADLIVVDPDNSFPADFTLAVLPGSGYTVNGHTVKPSANFYGTLIVQVTVNDGTDGSKPFPLSITVHPVNDFPEIVRLESWPLSFIVGKGPVSISENVEVRDVDNDNLTVAEITFDEATYRAGNDVLTYDNSQSRAISGVFDSGRGVMFLIGSAPASEYTQAIRAVHYNYIENTENITQDSTKVFEIKVNDGTVDSNPVSRQITLIKTISLSIPNWFTPNGDASNDTWKIRSLNSSDDYANALIRVYTIRGTVVYEALGLNSEWDGRYKGEILPSDTYYFTINLNLTYTNASYKGMVTILR